MHIIINYVKIMTQEQALLLLTQVTCVSEDTIINCNVHIICNYVYIVKRQNY